MLEIDNLIKNDNERMLTICVEFIEKIGIKTIYSELPAATFLPGLSIEAGCIIIDQQKLKYPGDVLHEAGHIAIVPAAERINLNAESIQNRNGSEAEEMMAIAWSYAACVYVGLNPYLIFHDEGYNGGGSYIAEAFEKKQYFGLPMLQWIGLTADEKNAPTLNVKPYPHMIKWLRD